MGPPLLAGMSRSGGVVRKEGAACTGRAAAPFADMRAQRMAALAWCGQARESNAPAAEAAACDDDEVGVVHVAASAVRSKGSVWMQN